MSRTYKDTKVVKAQRNKRNKRFNKKYRNIRDHGFDYGYFTCDVCPDCGSELQFERGFLSCEQCSWGTLFPYEPERDAELNFTAVAA